MSIKCRETQNGRIFSDTVIFGYISERSGSKFHTINTKADINDHHFIEIWPNGPWNLSEYPKSDISVFFISEYSDWKFNVRFRKNSIVVMLPEFCEVHVLIHSECTTSKRERNDSVGASWRRHSSDNSTVHHTTLTTNFGLQRTNFQGPIWSRLHVHVKFLYNEPWIQRIFFIPPVGSMYKRSPQ